MLAIASCARWPSSSTRVLEGFDRSSKWSGHSSSMLSSRSKSSSIVLPLVDDQLPLFDRGSIGIGGFDFFLGQIEIFVLLLQQRVFLHFLLDPFLQRQDRQLQDFHRLDHAGCEHLLLHHPQFLAEGKSHETSLLLADGPLDRGPKLEKNQRKDDQNFCRPARASAKISLLANSSTLPLVMPRASG